MSNGRRLFIDACRQRTHRPSESRDIDGGGYVTATITVLWGIPVMSLAATNLDGIMAIVLWIVFMTLLLGGGDLISTVGGTILAIALGVILGLGFGYLITRVFDHYLADTAFGIRAVLSLVLCVLVYLSGEVLPVNGPIALLAFGLFFVNTTKLEIRQVGEVVKHLWAFAAIFLFVLIGAAANLDLVLRLGMIGLAVIGIGVLARILGAYIALNLTKSGLSTPGKATVQATLAPLVVAAGVENGETILAIAVMSILVMAPLSTILIELTYRRLLKRAEPALTVASARFNDDWGTLAIIAMMLLIVMIVNLVVLLGESKIIRFINPQAIDVAERILGILLCALAVQTMLNGASELGIITLKAAGHG